MVEAGFLGGEIKKGEAIPLKVNKFGNSICFGATGSGKTTSYISINLANKMKCENGMLLFDFKGNLHLKAKTIAKKQKKLNRVIEIGKPWSSHINLLEYCDSKALEDYMHGFANRNVDSFWTNSAINLVTSVLELLDINKAIAQNLDIDSNLWSRSFIEEMSKEYSFRLLHKIVSDLQSIKEFIDKQSILKRNLENFYNRVDSDESRDKVALYHQKLSSLIANLEPYRTYKKNVNDGTGLSGVVVSASSSIQVLAKDDFLNKSGIDIVKKLEEGFMVIINSSNLNSQILSIIHRGVVSNLLKRAHKKSARAVSIFIDEAHQVLNSSTIPETSVCRENRFEYFLATQDISSLVNTFKSESIVEELLSNIHQQLEFKAENINKNPKEGFVYQDITNQKWGRVKPILISQKEEIEAEIEFQEINNIKDRFLLTNISDRGYIEYDKFLMSKKGKVIFKHITGETSEILFGAKYLLKEAKERIIEENIHADVYCSFDNDFYDS